MKVLVTGANGYLGTGIVKQLLDDGIYVIATDLQTANVDKRATCISANLFDLSSPFLELGQPDVLLHLAWRDGFKHDSDAHIIDLPKHFKFVKEMMDAGISQFCGLGSMHEIGFHEGSINEYTAAHPQNLYGIGKNALREMTQLLAIQKSVIFQWIRGYYIVGNTSMGNSIFSKIAKAESEGKRFFPFTTGVNQYDFIDYDDFCEQVAAVVEQKKISGIINCCSGYPMSLRDRVESFIKSNHYAIELKYGAFPDRPYDSKAVWGDNSKISTIMSERK